MNFRTFSWSAFTGKIEINIENCILKFQQKNTTHYRISKFRHHSRTIQFQWGVIGAASLRNQNAPSHHKYKFHPMRIFAKNVLFLFLLKLAICNVQIILWLILNICIKRAVLHSRFLFKLCARYFNNSQTFKGIWPIFQLIRNVL